MIYQAGMPSILILKIAIDNTNPIEYSEIVDGEIIIKQNNKKILSIPILNNGHKQLDFSYIIPYTPVKNPQQIYLNGTCQDKELKEVFLKSISPI